MSRTRSFTPPALLLALSAAACEPKPLTALPPPAPPPGPPPAATTATPVAAPRAALARGRQSRGGRARAAAVLDGGHQRVERGGSDELVVLWGMDSGSREDWVKAGAWTDKAKAAAASIAEGRARRAPHGGAVRSGAEAPRGGARRVAQGRPSAARRATSRRPRRRAHGGEARARGGAPRGAPAKQTGSFGLADKIPADDTASRMLFQRNQVLPPRRRSPRTIRRASRSHPSPRSSPGCIRRRCRRRTRRSARRGSRGEQGRRPAQPLRWWWVEEGGKLSAVPYTTHWKAEMTEVSRLLQSAADALKSPAGGAVQGVPHGGFEGVPRQQVGARGM